MAREAVIVDSVRTALTKAHRGSFNMTEPVDYTAHCLRSVVERVPNLDPAEIEDVILGVGMGEGYTHKDRSQRLERMHPVGNNVS